MKPATQRVVGCVALMMCFTLYMTLFPTTRLAEDPAEWPPSAHQGPASNTPSAAAAADLTHAAATPREPPADLPTHVTGQWTPALHTMQLKLLNQLGRSSLDYLRPHAPPVSPVDELIHQQLLSAPSCRSKLLNVAWTREDLLVSLKHFVTHVYPHRPITFNALGMRMSHAFGCWFVTKQLQPKYIIESGVHMGQSTWLLRQAAPDAKIISLDPANNIKHWDVNGEYHVAGGPKKEGYNIHPFTDFTSMDWSFLNKSEALILFDDHQNEWRRLLEAHALGFRHLMFDDNWNPLQGDNYSAKQICDATGGLALRSPSFPSKKVLMCDMFHMKDKFISLEEHQANHAKLMSLTKVYYESPPILFTPAHLEYTAFGHKPKVDTSPVNYVLPRPSNPLLRWMCEALIAPPIVQSESEFEHVGLAGTDAREFESYTNFGYVELR
eukprot:NODE_1815_length_1373_cov_17.161316_g1723_i0.p1 GENE.NODE_1815_length_1373_cov_17.161316_g1723_i0~~NODE_1815_length_1373_cov_17.161316_g1723_i0.p1  ORF type:complete len:439 (-),score=105.01 NODE_1815_length_1373_cov_17.161316_g1723_i0:20-1336(-)